MRLHGDPASNPPVWVTWTSPDHIPIVWPDGFYATFGPSLEIREPNGAVVAREGADVSTDQQAWPGLVICASDVVVHVYRLADLQ
jgi:hypothetical protein